MGIDDVRAGLALANQKTEESQGAIEQAILSLEEAQQALGQATQGTTQDDVQQAAGMFAEAMQTLTDVQGKVSAGMTAVEQYGGRL